MFLLMYGGVKNKTKTKKESNLYLFFKPKLFNIPLNNSLINLQAKKKTT